MEPETRLELLGCKVDFPQADEEAERGHTSWERTETGHGDKTTRSCRRILDPSLEGDRKKLRWHLLIQDLLQSNMTI